MRQRVEIIKIDKEGSFYFNANSPEYLLLLSRGSDLKIGDPVIGIKGISKIQSITSKDFFYGSIYYLEDNTSMANPRKILSADNELDLEWVKKQKDLFGPFYIEIENNEILKESGKILIFM